MQIYVIFLFYWKMNADDWGTYKDVQFSVHMAGLLGEFGPVKVSPHLMPLHVLICIDRKTQEKKKRATNKLLRTLPRESHAENPWFC